MDLRTIDDVGRDAILHDLSTRMYQICDKRSLLCSIERKVNKMSFVFKVVILSDVFFFLATDLFPCLSSLQHDADAVISDPHLSLQLKSAAQSALKKITGEIQDEVPVLMSGAGHDAMAMSYLTKVIELKLKKHLTVEFNICN